MIRDTIDPDEYVTNYNNMVQCIFFYQEEINKDSSMMKVWTTESKLLWKDLSIIKEVKTLYACCYGIPSTMEQKVSTVTTNSKKMKYW